MPIFAAHAVSAELSNGSTHEFTSAGSPRVRQQRENARATSRWTRRLRPRLLRTRHLRPRRASSPLVARRSSIAAFSRVEAGGVRTRAKTAPRRLPNAVFSSERRNSRPPAPTSTLGLGVPRGRERLLELLRLLPPVRVVRLRAAAAAAPRMPTPSSSTPMMNSSDTSSSARRRASLERRGASEDSSAKDSSAKDSSALRSAGRSLLITATHTSRRRVVAVARSSEARPRGDVEKEPSRDFGARGVEADAAADVEARAAPSRRARKRAARLGRDEVVSIVRFTAPPLGLRLAIARNRRDAWQSAYLNHEYPFSFDARVRGSRGHTRSAPRASRAGALRGGAGRADAQFRLEPTTSRPRVRVASPRVAAAKTRLE